MALFCQNQPYAREFNAVVQQCKAADQPGLWDLQCDDTVLFPEGGGQPDDRGTVDGAEVVSVQREGHDGVVTIRVRKDQDAAPFAQGQKVLQSVEWSRRWNHMQQHSGQHLISALAERFNYQTSSWFLGKELISTVDFDVKSIPEDHIRQIEDGCNEAIRARKTMSARLVERDSSELDGVRSKGPLPELSGPVRLVTIESIDENPCCGTHVSNLSDLQAVKILQVEPFKGVTRVSFVVGQRLIALLGQTFDRERALVRCTSVQASLLLDEVNRIKKVERQLFKANKGYLKELATLTGEKLSQEKAPFVYFHRDDADVEFLTTVANLVASDKVLFFGTGGEKDEGCFLLCGPETSQALGQKVAELVDGKGGGRKNRFQGKAAKIQNRTQALEWVKTQLPAAQ